MAVTHELKYKMNEFILNFPETLVLKRERNCFHNPEASLDSCIAFNVMPFSTPLTWTGPLCFLRLPQSWYLWRVQATYFKNVRQFCLSDFPDDLKMQVKPSCWEFYRSDAVSFSENRIKRRHIMLACILINCVIIFDLLFKVVSNRFLHCKVTPFPFVSNFGEILWNYSDIHFLIKLSSICFGTHGWFLNHHSS